MRLVAWNCNMALHRKLDALLRLRPDIAVVSECARPDVLVRRGVPDLSPETCVWVGDNYNKGLGVFAFNGLRVSLADPHFPALRHIAPVRIAGAEPLNLLAVWAQNASGGITRKRQTGPLLRALSRYRTFLTSGLSAVAGDFNSNTIWDRPGWRNNHAALVDRLGEFGLVSTYHELSGEAHGRETTPTLYWRDRRRDGPTYHIDYVFVPAASIETVTSFQIGSFDAWCGAGLSDHVPVVLDFSPSRP